MNLVIVEQVNKYYGLSYCLLLPTLGITVILEGENKNLTFTPKIPNFNLLSEA